jgi:hypothetical protein
MSDAIWFENPQILFDKARLLEFWPSQNQTSFERVNATTRFVLYATLMVYLTKEDNRVLILAAMSLLVMFVLYKGNVIKENSEARTVYSKDGGACQRPTKDNPMANFMFGADDPKRAPACYYPSVRGEVRTLLDDTIPHGNFRSRAADPQYQRNAAARQFVTTSVSTLGGSEQTDFAEFCYGKKFAPTCHEDPSVCSPNGRGVHLEAFGGLRVGGIRR